MWCRHRRPIPRVFSANASGWPASVRSLAASFPKRSNSSPIPSTPRSRCARWDVSGKRACPSPWAVGVVDARVVVPTRLLATRRACASQRAMRRTRVQVTRSAAVRTGGARGQVAAGGAPAHAGARVAAQGEHEEEKDTQQGRRPETGGTRSEQRAGRKSRDRSTRLERVAQTVRPRGTTERARVLAGANVTREARAGHEMGRKVARQEATSA